VKNPRHFNKDYNTVEYVLCVFGDRVGIFQGPACADIANGKPWQGLNTAYFHNATPDNTVVVSENELSQLRAGLGYGGTPAQWASSFPHSRAVQDLVQNSSISALVEHYA